MQRPGLDFCPGICAQRSLGFQGSANSACRCLENSMTAITGGFDDLSLVSFDALPQYGIVASKRWLHRLWVQLPQASAALDVGE
jgi:hypothetical protein